MKVCPLIKVVLFLTIGIMLFLYVQEVLTPEHSADVVRSFNGFESLEKDTVDIIFLGSSHMKFGISPMRIYANSGICSYNLSTSAQPIECSYFLAKRAFETQSPLLIVLDAACLFHNKENLNIGWRYIMDNAPLDINKIEMAKVYKNKHYADDFWTVVFPFLKFHTRWTELNASDFSIFDNKNPYYTAGEWISPNISGVNFSLEDVSITVDSMANSNAGYVTKRNQNTIKTEIINESLYSPSLSEHSIEYLIKLKELCTNHGAQLLLTKIPVLNYPQFYNSSWSKKKSNLVKNLAMTYAIDFYDPMIDSDIDIDFRYETSDAGNHLNYRGAEKMSVALNDYILNQYGIKGCTNTTYAAMLEKYKLVQEVAALQTETDFNTYIDMLIKHHEGWSIYIAAQEEYTTGLQDSDYLLLESLGLQLIQDGGYSDSYVAVINNGQVKYEAVSDRKIRHFDTNNGTSIYLNSSGWYTSPNSSIKIRNVEYSTLSRGLNIVVFDNKTGLVIDSVAFDTHSSSKTAKRRSALAYFSAYSNVIDKMPYAGNRLPEH